MNDKDCTTLLDATHAAKSAGGSSSIRILIADDQPAVRKAIAMRLAAETDLLVIGEAADGVATLDLAMSLRPDIVLMDVEMPLMDGLAATYALRRLCPGTSVIILTIHDDELTRARAREVGATAFVSKSLPPDALLTAIRQALRARLDSE
jgi:two-component system, NarL family, response regulator NreC